jgi:hypothetical protein
MQKHKALSAVGLWWRWVIATFVGVAVGYPLGIAACLAGFHHLSNRLIGLGLCTTGYGNLNCPVSVGITLGAIVAGTLVGIGQYFLVRKLIRSSGWWVLASTLGWTWIGFTATSLAYTAHSGFAIGNDGTFTQSTFSDRLPLLAANSLWLIASGLILGILQFLVIWNGAKREATKRRALLWIMVNVTLTTFMAIAILAIFRGRGSLYNILIFFIEFTPLYATITGAALTKMRL